MFQGRDYHVEVCPDEYDRLFIMKLDQILMRKFDAVRLDEEKGLEKLNNINRWTYDIAGIFVCIQAQATMGISLHGPKKLVDAVAKEIGNTR